MLRSSRVWFLTLCFLISTLAAGPAVRAESAPAPTVQMDGAPVSADVPPFIDQASGRTMVPLRAIAQAMGYTIAWDGATQSVAASRTGSPEFRMQIGSREAIVGGVRVTLDVAPRIVGNRTFVPLRFFAEATGANVAWDGSTRTVTITTPTSAGAPPEAGWAHEQGGNGRTGFDPTAEADTTLAPLWTSTVQPATDVVLGDGMLFVVGTDKQLYALSQATGAVLWSVSIPATYRPSTPTFDPARHRVYVIGDAYSRNGSMIHALDAATGAEAWFAVVGQYGYEDSVPLVVGDQVVVSISGSGETIYGLDAGRGDLLWTASGDLGEVPAAFGNRIFTGYVYAQADGFRAGDGAHLWSQRNGYSGGCRCTAVVADGRVFVANDQKVLAVDEATGSVAWEYSGGFAGWSEDGPAYDGRLWVPSSTGLLVMNAATGAIERNLSICGGSPPVPVISRSHAFTSCGGKLLAIDRNTQQVSVLGDGSAPLALGGSRLYYVKKAGDNGFVAAMQVPAPAGR